MSPLLSGMVPTWYSAAPWSTRDDHVWLAIRLCTTKRWYTLPWMWQQAQQQQQQQAPIWCVSRWVTRQWVTH